jgi:hypothetical protein
MVNNTFCLKFSDPETIDVKKLKWSLDYLYLWSKLYGYSVKLNSRLPSIFRTDNKPNCYLREKNGEVIFYDYAKHVQYDIVSAYMDKYNLSFKEALNLIVKDSNIDTKFVTVSKPVIQNPFEFKLIVYANVDKNNKPVFNKGDALFWSKREISIKNLMEDKVYPLVGYASNSRKNPNELLYKPCTTPTYAFIVNKGCKVYQPYEDIPFLSTLSPNDYGGIIPKKGKLLIITKGYKEYRHLKNMGYNSIWFQGERMFPDKETLANLSQRFKNILILFDNDPTGIEGSLVLSELIPNSIPLYIKVNPEDKDLDDLVVRYGLSKTKKLIDAITKRSLVYSRNTRVME